jgi:predicted ATP-dependent protease
MNMELTKQQIQHIDHRLENEGVKYWDIRIEMLDHVVSDVEQKLKPENSEYEFKEKVQESFVALGWKENFNGGGFEKIYHERVTFYTKKSNREIRKEILVKLKKKETIIFTLLFFSYLFIFRNTAVVIKYTTMLMIFLVLVAVIGFILNYKIVKSAKFNLLLLFASLPLSMFNLFMFSPKTIFGYENVGSTYIALLLGFTVPFLVIIISLLYQEFKSAKKTYNKFII